MITPLRIAGLLATGLTLAGPPAFAFDPFVSENGDVKEGNALLAQGKPKEALAAYDEAARSLPGRAEVHLNRGLALLRQGGESLAPAMQAFTLASGADAPAPLRARAFSGLGRAALGLEDYDQAISAFRQSLLLAPGNRDVAFNYELAKRKKKEKEDQEKKDQEKQDQQKKDQQQDQQQQDQQQKDQQQKDQQQQDQQQKDQQQKDQQQQDQQQQQQQQQQDQQQQPPPQAKKPKTPEEVEQILRSLDEGEENLLKEKARRAGRIPAGGVEKDW